MAYDIRPLSLAEVFDRGFRVLRVHFRLLVGIAAWAWIPYGVLLALSESHRIYAGLAMLVFLIVSPLMYAALIIAVGAAYLDQEPLQCPGAGYLLFRLALLRRGVRSPVPRPADPRRGRGRHAHRRRRRDFDHCLIFPIPRSISLRPRFSRARSTARRPEGIRYS